MIWLLYIYYTTLPDWRWRGKGGIRRICRIAWWWRRAWLSNSHWSILPLVFFPCNSCFNVIFNKKNLNNQIGEIHKDQHHELWGTSWGTRSPGTSHPAVCQNSAATVGKTSQEKKFILFFILKPFIYYPKVLLTAVWSRSPYSQALTS